MKRKKITVVLCGMGSGQQPPGASRASEPVTLFQNVRIFDGKGSGLSAPSNVLIRGNKIERISTTPIPVDRSANTQIIDGGGRTLMPGLIDAHTHIMFATLPQFIMLVSDAGYITVAATRAAGDMLMRGFTSIRDLGGPVLGLKKGIDQGLVAGPRIWSTTRLIKPPEENLLPERSKLFKSHWPNHWLTLWDLQLSSPVTAHISDKGARARQRPRASCLSAPPACESVRPPFQSRS